MGGCCCGASKGEGLNNLPPPYHHSSASGAHQPLAFQHGSVSAASMGLLVDTNLDTSIPETYRSPPAPVPYETYVWRPQIPLGGQDSHGDKNGAMLSAQKSVEVMNSVGTEETAVKVVVADGNAKNNVELTAAKEVEDDLEKSGELKKPGEPILATLLEEDVCPICLEEYDAENPKILTQCGHHFHLACIFEWMERSDTCPVCDQETVIITVNGS